jgi:DNA-binding transcriptional LysR family regulator
VDRFQEMKVLLAVTQAKSFGGGARLMGMSPSGVTRAIAALEARLGIALLARNSRTLRLPEAGRRYVEDCRRILLELEEAEALAAGSDLRARGSLTVTAPVMFGELFLIPLIAEYLALHPEVVVNALLVDRLVSMADEAVDVAIRIGQLPDGNIDALKVGEIRSVVCASPAFLDRVGRPAHPRDIQGAQVVMSSASRLLTQWQFNGSEDPVALTLQPRLVVSSNQAAINAARMGWGYTRVLSYQIAEAVAKGELEIVLAEFGTAPLPVHILCQSGRQMPARVRTFVDHCYSRLVDDSALQHIAAC